MAIDFAALLKAVIPDIPDAAVEIVRGMAERGVTRKMEAVGALLFDHLGLDGLARIASHPSDTARGWACYAIGLAPKLRLKARLDLIRPLADDPHFGVREWAWMPLRPHLTANVGHAVASLKPWVTAESPNLRRFAVEATRPRGVWCSHIETLKQNPGLALPLLEPLRADTAEYVQNSVANWLNDAAKSQPAWVTALCERWKKESPSAATIRICRRATRNLG